MLAEISNAKIDPKVEPYKEYEEKLVRPIAVVVLKNIMYFVLAVLYAIILRFIFVAIAKGLKKSDVISTTDMIIGGAVGVVKGFIVVLLISNLLVYIQPRIEKPESREAISKSFVVSTCDNLNPMDDIAEELEGLKFRDVQTDK